MKIYWKLKATSQEEVSSESGERSRSRGDVGLRLAFGNRSEFAVVGVQSGNDYINTPPQMKAREKRKIVHEKRKIYIVHDLELTKS
jgi:hypothetical protein